MNTKRNAVFSTFLGQKTMFTRAFLIAGLGFLGVCLIGFLTSSVIYNGLTSRFSASNIFTLSMILIFASGIVNLIWAFRVLTASRGFIYFAFSLFVIAEGLGFGILFSIFSLQQLSIIFGSAGIVFLAMAFAGYKAKDLRPMVPFLISGTIALLVIGLLSFILYWFLPSGMFDGLMILWSILGGILFMAYTAFDVWRLKTLSLQASENIADPEMVFRFTAFFAFRLLSDLIALIWIIARFVLRFSR